MKKTKALGRGLSALIPDEPALEMDSPINEGIREIAVTDILPSSKQPRRVFTADVLSELSASIKEHGVLQPLVVRPLSSGKYEIIAGERRWRASKEAGLKKVPVVIKDVTDGVAMQIALIENIQRENLNPVEEAEAFQRLIHEYNMTQDDMGKRVGKSRPYITNSLRLLGLHSIVRSLLSEGKISTGHARALVALEDEEQIKLAQRIISENLSVRETEKAIAYKAKPKPLPHGKAKICPDIKSFENDLRTKMTTKVRIRQADKGGVIEIFYYDDEDLTRVADILLESK
jgi:ParB family chromosome partitioning protein